MAEPDDFICVGAIAGAFGVKGEVRLKSFTEDPVAIFGFGPLLDETGAVRLTVTSHRSLKDDFGIFAEEISTREEALAAKSRRLYVLRAQFPDLDEDEFYQSDLAGLTVKRLDGTLLGEVRGVQNYGADDLLEIWKTPGVRESWLLPFSKAVVPHINLAAGEVIVDPTDDMLPD